METVAISSSNIDDTGLQYKATWKKKKAQDKTRM